MKKKVVKKTKSSKKTKDTKIPSKKTTNKKVAKKKVVKKSSKKKTANKPIAKKKEPKKIMKKKKGFFSNLFHLSDDKPIKKKETNMTTKHKKEIPQDNSNKSNLKQVMEKELKLDKKFQKNNSQEKNLKKTKTKADLKKIAKLEKVGADLQKKIMEEQRSKNIKDNKKNPNETKPYYWNRSSKQKQINGKFIKTGIKGFDALFHKDMGIPNGAAVLVEGGPGSGKTVFCLATLNELCKQGKKGLYMSFEESEGQLISHMQAFNWKPEDYIKKGLLRIQRFDAIDVSRSIEALLSAAKKELLIDVEPMFFPDDFEPDFVVIDSLTSIASAFSGEESRFRIYMEQLFRYLEKNKITNFLIREVSSPSHIGTTFKEQGEAVSFLSDGIIVIYNVNYDSGKRGSAIEILKMRGSSFDKHLVELKITNKKGVTIHPDKIIKKGGQKKFNLT